jgi:hypothetical protein
MFPVVIVPAGAAELSEQMGTKFKFWYLDEQRRRTLFKEGRPGTGENWAEKLAAEFAELLGIPHAHYELAEWKDRQGVISPSLVSRGDRLIHGNELIEGKVTVASDDETVRYYEQRSHIATRAFQLLKKHADIILPPQTYKPIEGVHSALGVFVGYLLFDAWIANQDRHSENWGVVGRSTHLYLAPSYDHGSSLGRNETDERRKTIMTTKDKGSSMSAYVAKARSAFYPPAAGDAKVKAHLTYDLFQLAYKVDPVAGEAWKGRLGSINDAAIASVINQVPAKLMSDVAREFTAKLLRANIDRLIV